MRRLPSIASVDVLRMIYDIARGMEYIHRNMILHGDLKVSFREPNV